MNNIIIKLAVANDAKKFMNRFGNRIRVTMNYERKAIINSIAVSEKEFKNLISDESISCTMDIYSQEKGSLNLAYIYKNGRPFLYSCHELIEDADDLDFALGIISEEEYAKAKGIESWA